jgi:ABC-type glutathione transport system ATPase component
MIEHDIDVALALADRVTVLHHGKVILDGTPGEVQTNALVREVVLWPRLSSRFAHSGATGRPREGGGPMNTAGDVAHGWSISFERAARIEATCIRRADLSLRWSWVPAFAGTTSTTVREVYFGRA